MVSSKGKGYPAVFHMKYSTLHCLVLIGRLAFLNNVNGRPIYPTQIEVQWTKRMKHEVGRVGSREANAMTLRRLLPIIHYFFNFTEH